MPRPLTRTTYAILKASEGGLTRSEAMRLVREAGARLVWPTDGSYIGHFALEITATKAAHRKITRTLYRS